MYGWNCPFERQNIVTASLAKLKNNETVSAYEDVYSNPLYSQSCAAAIWKIVSENKTGAFNIAGRDRVNVFELIRKAATIFGYDDSAIVSVKQGFFKELVKMPRYTSLSKTKMVKDLLLTPLSIMEGLSFMKESYKE